MGSDGRIIKREKPQRRKERKGGAKGEGGVDTC